jgi:hypothetical protein
MAFRTAQDVINMSQYRKNTIWERVLASLAYPIFVYLGLSLGGMQFFTFIALFLVMWTICRSPYLKTPVFIKYHVAQAFALAIALDFIRAFLQVLLKVIWSVLALLPFDFLESSLTRLLPFLSDAVLLSLIALIGYCLFFTLKGRQQELPLAGQVARSIVY